MRRSLARKALTEKDRQGIPHFVRFHDCFVRTWVREPSVSFHDLNGGGVIGGLCQISATVRFLERFEARYRRSLNSTGNTPGLSLLFEGGFNTFHGKANFVSENAGKHDYLPALSAGFILRSQVQHVGRVIAGKNTTNGDAYLVATKTITQIKSPIVANLGIKATNALAFGLTGNEPAWQGRLFGALVSCPDRRASSWSVGRQHNNLITFKIFRVRLCRPHELTLSR